MHAVQLTHRHWQITDARAGWRRCAAPAWSASSRRSSPGQSFRYTSGCPLKTPSGIMAGSYQMVDEDGQAFDVDIPAFSLDSPYARRVLN